MVHEREYLCQWKAKGPRAQLEDLATDGQKEHRVAGILVALVVGRSGSWSDCTSFICGGQSEVRLRMKEEGVSKIEKKENVKLLHCGEGKGIFQEAVIGLSSSSNTHVKFVAINLK